MIHVNKYFVSKPFLNKVKDSFPVLAVMVVIDFGNKALLIKRAEEPMKGKWWLPGSRVFKREKGETTAKRVAKQEVGLDCSVVRFIGNVRETYRTSEFADGWADFLSMTYVLKPVDKNQSIRLDATSTDYKFITKIERNLHENVRKPLDASGIFKK